MTDKERIDCNIFLFFIFNTEWNFAPLGAVDAMNGSKLFQRWFEVEAEEFTSDWTLTSCNLEK